MKAQSSQPKSSHRISAAVSLFILTVTALLLLLYSRQNISAAPSAPTAPSYSIFKDNKKQWAIQVDGPGSSVTLAEIRSAVVNTDTTYLVDQGNGIWLLNVNLIIGKEVTLNLSPTHGVKELRLRSGKNGVVTQAQRIANANTPDALDGISYSTFVYLKAEDGTINIDNMKVYSWDPSKNKVDEDETNGRAYILAKYASTLNIRNSDIGYLGSKDGESYGISWRDVGESGGEFVTRVTGEVINSKIHHHYYGIYTYQAQNMVFRGNEFYSNIRYGFDPHDYSHHFIVEDNVAYDNGAHGFIISRGCHNFIFRRNRSYNNFDPGSNLAHGFMLDPGGANIDKPQVSSSENLLENNEAYNNEGYGIRILGSSDNTIRNNYFHKNEMGISIDKDSDRNIFQNNRIEENERYGFFIRENRENRLQNNQIQRNGTEGIEVRKAVGMEIQENTIRANGSHGADFSDSAKNNLLLMNTIEENNGYGISVSNSKSTGNRWSQNRIAGNQDGGIYDRTGKLDAPQLDAATTTQLQGRTKANATVEVFVDTQASGQGPQFVGQTTANSNGNFTFTGPGSWGGSYLTAIALDQSGNASPFSAPIEVSGDTVPTATAVATATPTATPTPTPTPQPTMTVTPSPTATRTSTPAAIPSTTGTAVPTVTATGTAIATATATALVPATGTPTPTGTASPTRTLTPTVTPLVSSTPVGTGLTEQFYLPIVVR